MISMNEGCAMLTALSPALARVDLDLVAEWDPQEPPPTIRMADYARALAEECVAIPVDVRQRILNTVEKLMVQGDDLLQTAVATGFLERLLNAVLDGQLDRVVVQAMLGPESLAYFKEWERFSDHM